MTARRSAEARRPVVVKLGSSIVVGEDGRARADVLERVAGAVADRVARGERVAVVSSGAIALGRARAKLDGRRKRTIARLQAASALGQAELQRSWEAAFARHEIPTAQVLLTAFDIAERRSYVNVREALTALFEVGAVPVLNENDATSTDEISFSDNDVLAAQVAVLLRARLLVLLTGVEGVLARPPGEGAAEVIVDGSDVGETALYGPGTSLGRGGIESKVAAAQLAAAGGVDAYITSPEALPDLLAGEARGTRFAAEPPAETAFKLWLRYGKRPVSTVEIDEGAARAITESGASLLAVGVRSWNPDFRAGDGLEICSRGYPVARGIARVDAEALADRPRDVEVVHRDQLVLL